MKKTVDAVFFAVFFATLSLFMFMFLGYYIQIWQQTHNSSNWPSVPGKIHMARLIMQHRQNPSSIPYYALNIQYDYQVGTQKHSGFRRGPSENLMPLEEANKQLNQFAVGKQVKVYYDPENPSQSLLSPDESLPLWPLLMFCLLELLALIGLGVSLYFLYSRWRTRASFS